MDNLQAILPVMEQVVRRAGAHLLDREKSARVHTKGYADFVTEVDLAVEQIISEALSRAFPHIQFMGEEQDNSALDRSGALWILDPVDGITNLIRDLRASAISLGLCENRRTVAAVIYQPYLDEMFTAIRGGGAYLNGAPIHVTGNEDLSACVLGVGTCPYHHQMAGKTFGAIQRVFERSLDIRRSGSAAIDLANVAAGRTDGMFELLLQPWDFAAGMLLVEEAGGKLTTCQGTPADPTAPSSVLASNGRIHREFLDAVNE